MKKIIVLTNQKKVALFSLGGFEAYAEEMHANFKDILHELRISNDIGGLLIDNDVEKSAADVLSHADKNSIPYAFLPKDL